MTLHIALGSVGPETTTGQCQLNILITLMLQMHQRAAQALVQFTLREGFLLIYGAFGQWGVNIVNNLFFFMNSHPFTGLITQGRMFNFLQTFTSVHQQLSIFYILRDIKSRPLAKLNHWPLLTPNPLPLCTVYTSSVLEYLAPDITVKSVQPVWILPLPISECEKNRYINQF